MVLLDFNAPCWVLPEDETYLDELKQKCQIRSKYRIDIDKNPGQPDHEVTSIPVLHLYEKKIWFGRIGLIAKIVVNN